MYVCVSHFQRVFRADFMARQQVPRFLFLAVMKIAGSESKMKFLAIHKRMFIRGFCALAKYSRGSGIKIQRFRDIIVRYMSFIK